MSYWGQTRVCAFAYTVFLSDKRASSGDSPEWYVWSDVVQILVMLFADDVLFASYCVAGLRSQIYILKHFTDNFLMTVNMSKTKIIVFRKGGFLAASEVWRYGDEEIEVVNSYKYLGLYFTPYCVNVPIIVYFKKNV